MRHFLAIALVLLAACSRDGGAPVVVSAAASLSNVLSDLGREYRRRTGTPVSINVGASNTLARQIAAGARVDLFVSADETQMNAVAADIVPGTRVDLLSNQLAIAVPEDRFRPLASARDLLMPEFRRIAVGEPSAVPAGVYARAYFERLGIWSALAPRLVPSGSVRLALAAVETGAADAAVVYRTDVATAPHARTAFVIPASEGPRIVYPAAVIRGGASPQTARGLLAFLRTADAAAVFERAGFVALHHER